MKLVYVVSYYKPAYVYGGPTRSMSALCEALAAAGVDVTVLTTDANGAGRLAVPLGSAVDVDGVPTVYHPVAGGPRMFFYSPALGRACAERIPAADAVVLEGIWTHAMVVASAACRRAGVPYVVPLRGGLLPWAMREKGLKKRVYMALSARRALDGAAALYCTDDAEAAAARALGLRAPAFVVPNGIDAARWAGVARGELRGRLGVPPEAPLLMQLGRLHHKKRPDIAVRALASACGAGHDAHLALVGPDEGGLAPGLRSLAESLGCAGRLHITGLVEGDAAASALADADLLLMPSAPESENFGMAAAEALAAGVAVLTSDGVPVGRAAERAGAGRVVACDAAAFGAAAAALLGDLPALRQMGRLGRELAQRSFDRAAVARRVLRQLQAIARTGVPIPDHETSLTPA